jgi:hypothetical protein
MSWCRAAGHAQEHTVERPRDRLAADERAHRDTAHASRLEGLADLADGVDRAEREVGVARGEEDRRGVAERLEDARGRARLLRALVPDVVHLVPVRATDEPLLERERPRGRDDVRAKAIVARRQDARAQPRALDELGRDLRERTAVAQGTPTHEVEAEVEVAEPEPVLPAPRACGFERVPRLPGTAPAAPLVEQARQRVQEAVEIGRDVHPQHLDVVADVADDRELAGREHVPQPPREAGSSTAAGE